MEQLKGKDILVGRDGKDRRLLIAIPGKGHTSIGQPGSVPANVSRCQVGEGVAHVKITVDGNGNLTLTNMKRDNVTYVNGVQVVNRHIEPTSSVLLGPDQYRIDLGQVLTAARRIAEKAGETPRNAAASPGSSASSSSSASSNTFYNISPLRRVWEEYEEEQERIVKKQQAMGRKRMIPMMSTVLLGALTGIFKVTGNMPDWVDNVTLVGTLISLVVWLYNFFSKDTSFQDRKTSMEKLQSRYVCPKAECGRFLGTNSYEFIKRQYKMKCPYCGAAYTES